MKLQDPFAQLETYHDTLLDRFFIGYFAKKMSQQLGGMTVLAHQTVTSPRVAATHNAACQV